MTQSIKGARAALYVACRDVVYAGKVDSLGNALLVTYGVPGSYQPQNIVAVGLKTRQPITRPTMSTSRSREKEASIDVTISIFRAGGSDVQQAAAEDCDDLALLLEAYFRTKPNEELGGACREAFVSNIDGPDLQAATNPESGAVVGYIAESVATVIARVRY